MLLLQRFLTVGCALGVGTSVWLIDSVRSASAQLTDGTLTGQQDSEFGSLDGPEGLNPIDLLHRSRLSNGRSLQDFSNDSERSLNNASSDFRQQQQQQLRQTEQSASDTEPDVGL
ncbi:hypothetical protein KR51_00033400 [Rubidibacter lacunae KORDI 51-2]|uniref:Uncharacterized protein n=1 Tax=Rubidibacter lacunae KORDI 51-2 TaxID=582515 RepID=U5DEM2_9CHRO|nr:hypothetical protein [Rubidibacter lacunae]ERN40061.1 hypothetical protein KR51_00033400 [Rubidibacter lacunae KORDI 51-2]